MFIFVGCSSNEPGDHVIEDGDVNGIEEKDIESGESEDIEPDEPED